MNDHQPMIDITLEWGRLRVWGGILLVIVIIALGLLGAAVSPLVDRHPVLLTPERLAIKHYLDSTTDWIGRLNDIERRLASIDPGVPSRSRTAPSVRTSRTTLTATWQLTTPLPAHIKLPAETPLPALGQPARLPGDLYERAQRGEQIVQELQTIDREMQQIETPDALQGLHLLAQTTLQRFAQWSASVLDAVGAPTPDNLASLSPARQAAQASLKEWRTTLRTQQGTTRD